MARRTRNIFGLFKTETDLECPRKVRESRLSFKAALDAAYRAGINRRRKRQYDEFEDWLCSAGLSNRSKRQREAMREFFDRGVTRRKAEHGTMFENPNQAAERIGNAKYQLEQAYRPTASRAELVAAVRRAIDLLQEATR